LIVQLGSRRAAPPKPRPPLPQFPPGDYVRTLPWTPPRTRDYLRADSWGVTLPGAPWVPGASSKHPERILSWFVDRYDPDWQARYLDTVAGYGYSHLKLSYGDSCQGNGQSLDQLIATCLRVKTRVPYVQMMIGSKVYHPHDMSTQQWADFADPIMDALIAAHAVDEFLLGWEWNLWNVPGDTTIQAFKHAGQKAHAAGCSFWMHFSQQVTSWFKDGDPRGRYGFYDDIGTDVDGLNYQTGANADGTPWDCAMLQARIVDTLHQFGEQGNRHKMRVDETLAWRMFDGDRPNEDDANLYGYVGCCTVDNVKHTDARVWGFGNGGRMPDGTPL
jgi:hypothetical protein